MSEAYKHQLIDIVQSGITSISDIKPSAWVEQNVVMPNKPFPGPFRYNKTPYTREIIDCLAPDHPARWVAIKKGAQVGFSSGVIYPGVGYIIKNHPGNIAITVGAPDLIEKAMGKLDIMIDNAALRQYIKSQIQRKKNQKTGDTNQTKEFAGGSLIMFSAGNHNAIRQVDLMYGFFDDFEAVKADSKKSGSTRKLLEQRFAAYADTHKIFYISTPELLASSNIEEAYLLGDRRKFLLPCPCCGDFIDLQWSIPLNDKENAGITWKVDDLNRVVPDSVGYVCQKCGGFFTDRTKHKLLNDGFWQPTVNPSKLGYYSYHLSSLYAPVGMYDWEHYVNDWLEAHPQGQPRKESLYKTFVNVCLGECYEESAINLDANALQKNCRNYLPTTIAEKLSISDGNGRIVLLTCAADMNGTVDDARLDYEVVAWSEGGASYSVLHGSIGTFIPREGNNKADRFKLSYDSTKPNNVWTEFEKIIFKDWETDTGRKMRIWQTGLDCGYHSVYAYSFIDKSNPFPMVRVAGIKGKGEEEYIRFNRDLKYFKPAQERPNLYILTVGKIKDELSEHMQLRWNAEDAAQPFGFMNFPTPHGGLYGFSNFFEHFESEHCLTEANKEGTGIASRWQKKSSSVMNHMWDCRVYNIAIKEIIVESVRKELKQPKLTWKEFCAVVTGGK